MKIIQGMLLEISTGNWTYHSPSIKFNNDLKMEGKTLGQRSLPRKVDLHPIRDVLGPMQYENNLANGIVRRH